MDAATINEALRFGSERTYRTDDLGKFGLGLKTASLSQCRQIWIASRVSPKTNRVEARRFDLDRIIRGDKWDIEIISANARPTSLTEPLSSGTGTVVLWTQLDRLLGFRVPRGESAHNTLLEMTERLEQHLAMVFHRFLEGDVPRRRKLVITINGNKVAPWNPFALDEEKTKHLVPREFDINANGAQGFVSFDPYVLPTKEQFFSESSFNRMSGPNRWNHQQGLYIYRANRMIQSGGWSRLRAADEHTKLARAALDFFPELDAAFGINIAKMRVQLPTALRERLKDPLKELISAADKAYRQKPDGASGKSAVTGVTSGSTAPSPKAKPTPPPVGGTPPSSSGQGSAGKSGGISWPPQPLIPKATDLRSALESAAKGVGEKAALDRIVKQLKADAPGVARDLGW
jgi:hypothetical protein